MAIVSISEAARLTGKSRKTIQRYVAEGRISMSHPDAGTKGIDISELARVFGTLSQQANAMSHASMSQSDAPDVAALQATIDGLKAVVQAKDETIDSLRQAMRLLEHHSQPAKRRWWQFRID
jgi:predicted site-specific integrase-resolvase